MKKSKKIIAMCLTAAMALSAMSIGAFASDTGDSVFVTINGRVCEGYVSTEPTPYGDVAADPTPYCDQNLGNARAARVTASDVQRIQLGADPEYPYEYVADGYVTMMDGTAAAYHYSRAEMWWNSALDKTSGNVWGYGKVDATSWPTPNRGTAKIFYGTQG